MRAAWEIVASRLMAYSLVTSGDASFICQAELCSAHCCKKFTVNLDQTELQHLAAVTGLPPSRFLECEEGVPVVLPLAQPYVLSRTDGHCTLLGDDLLCTAYDGRPGACRLYPYFIVAVDVDSRRPVYGDVDAIRAACAAAARGALDGPLVPLLLRHLECPGFTGPAQAPADFWRLFGSTAALQYPVAAGSEAGAATVTR
jgi:Fe-S-cluster containining protein